MAHTKDMESVPFEASDDCTLHRWETGLDSLSESGDDGNGEGAAALSCQTSGHGKVVAGCDVQASTTSRLPKVRSYNSLLKAARSKKSQRTSVASSLSRVRSIIQKAEAMCAGSDKRVRRRRLAEFAPLFSSFWKCMCAYPRTGSPVCYTPPC